MHDTHLEALNKRWPIGTIVRYWPGAREGDGRLGKIRSPWWRLAHGAVVVKVTGYAGGIANTHVEPLATNEIEALPAGSV